jgi:hypothetical protein
MSFDKLARKLICVPLSHPLGGDQELAESGERVLLAVLM